MVEVLLAALNVVQVVALAWIGLQTYRSGLERERRRKIDAENGYGG